MLATFINVILVLAGSAVGLLFRSEEHTSELQSQR